MKQVMIAALLIVAGTTIALADGRALDNDARSSASVEQVTPRHLGKVSTLANLTPDSGEAPSAGLILANDGNFYGTTSSGGTGKKGTVLRVTPAGVATALYSFPRGGDRYTSYAPLVQGSDGALYGVETAHNADRAIIFRVTLDGQFNQFGIFDNGYPSLMLGHDGNLYGTTAGGGANGLGEFFRMSNTGKVTVIAALDASTPNLPKGPPLEGDDGSFYVAAAGGGSFGFGGLLQISTNGTIKTLYEFNGTQPSPGRPIGRLVYDASHEYIWGQTSDTENLDEAAVFRYRSGAVEEIGSLHQLNVGPLALGPDGVHFYLTSRTNVYSFAAGDEAREVAVLPGKTGFNEQLLFDSAGIMYGTTFDGGTDDGGTAFEVKHF